ncbi:MAG TPA: SDR family NAD(P)-dependent oxidoreductase [Dehalococcoidia bacterium]
MAAGTLIRPGLAVGSAVALGLLARRLRQRPLDLRGRVVLVTGGSRGLGLALAREFARRGCRLVICARSEAELERARADLEARGAEVLAVPCDVGDQEQVGRLVGAATGRFGRIDVLVNNAGIISMGPLRSQTVEDFRAAMDAMFWGVLYPTLAVLPGMLARREGRILNVTSIGGKVSAPHLLPYGSAKFAAVGLSEGLRAELAREGVTVTTVVPGFMRTGSFVNALFKGRHRAEYAWFSVLGNLPFTSMAAQDAARRVVEAARRGEAEVTLGAQAWAASRLQGLFPGLTADVLALVNRLLPRPDGLVRAAVPGRESETALTSSFLTALGRRAVPEYLQDAADGAGAAPAQAWAHDARAAPEA